MCAADKKKITNNSAVRVNLSNCSVVNLLQSDISTCIKRNNYFWRAGEHVISNTLTYIRKKSSITCDRKSKLTSKLAAFADSNPPKSFFGGFNSIGKHIFIVYYISY